MSPHAEMMISIRRLMLATAKGLIRAEYFPLLCEALLDEVETIFADYSRFSCLTYTEACRVYLRMKEWLDSRADVVEVSGKYYRVIK